MRLKESSSLILIIAMGLCVLLTVCSCKGSKQAKEIDTKKGFQDNRQIKMEQNVKDLANKLNAVDRTNLEFKFFSPIYTLHMQEKLIEPTGRPILFYAHINDVMKKGEQYLVRLESDTWYPRIYYDLKCSAAHAKELLELNVVTGDIFAVIAQIDLVDKPRLNVEAKGYEGGEAEIFIESEEIFIATGRCLDFLLLGKQSH